MDYFDINLVDLVSVADVMGVMNEISTERQYVRDGKVTKMIVIELTDERYLFYLWFN